MNKLKTKIKLIKYVSQILFQNIKLKILIFIRSKFK